MATLTYRTPTEIAQEYLTHLKGLKPMVNADQSDSDWYARSRVVGGVVSGVYSDIRALGRDIFPQSSRSEALEKHLETWTGSGYKDAQKSQGYVAQTGSIGSAATIGMEYLHEPSGNTYVLTENRILAATAELFPIESVNTGQDQNLFSGTILKLTSPPPGFGTTASASGNISDGRNKESRDEGSDRVLALIRNPLAGGKESDYVQFARDADPAVVSANVIRHPYGLGTVGVVITAGTTDIDTALDGGIPIIVVPSSILVDKVQEYVDTQKPITDCAFVIAPAEIPIAVTVKVAFSSGDKDTVLSGQTLTQGQLVEREVKRAIYHTPPGGRQFGANGYVVASEIEEMIDERLSYSPIAVGQTIEIVSDRQVLDLSASGANRMILGNEVAIPGVITIASF